MPEHFGEHDAHLVVGEAIFRSATRIPRQEGGLLLSKTVPRTSRKGLQRVLPVGFETGIRQPALRDETFRVLEVAGRAVRRPLRDGDAGLFVTSAND